jgi:hypothetical protein
VEFWAAAGIAAIEPHRIDKPAIALCGIRDSILAIGLALRLVIVPNRMS